MSSSLFLLLLFTVFITVSTTSNQQCLYNREDILPCMAYGNQIVSPGANQYTIHATRFQRNSKGLPICLKREEDQIVEDIITLGMDNVKFLTSPGAEKEPSENYTNQILVEYNVTCKHDQTAFIRFEKFDLEPANCFNKCQDYVHIDAGLKGLNMEYCGNSMTKESFTVGIGKFTMKLRTSVANAYPGFLAFVVCFENGVQTFDRKKRDSCDTSTSTESQIQLVDLSAPQNADSQANAKRDSVSARGRKSSINWPPASYKMNKTGDIVDLSELEPPALLTSSSKRATKYVSAFQPTVASSGTLRQRRLTKLRRLTRKRIGRETESVLDNKTLMVALMNENSCNPVVSLLAKDYLEVAQKVDPERLAIARQVYEEESSRT